mmetsp:Transcript_44279/g.116375  ORF Transcript_44279/g.116375 Transcript_44279/m.116375 type:complete len:135 (-) Transcript_44279:78-482(-)
MTSHICSHQGLLQYVYSTVPGYAHSFLGGGGLFNQRLVDPTPHRIVRWTVIFRACVPQPCIRPPGCSASRISLVGYSRAYSRPVQQRPLSFIDDPNATQSAQPIAAALEQLLLRTSAEDVLSILLVLLRIEHAL